MGSGYVRLFTELATARFPDRNIAYINKGIGGNRITDLKERWRDDVLFHKPDRLSIKIGINDLHSHLRNPQDGVSPEHFASVYDEVLGCTRDELNCPLLLITPFYISDGLLGRHVPFAGSIAPAALHRDGGGNGGKIRCALGQPARHISRASAVPRCGYVLPGAGPSQPYRTHRDSGGAHAGADGVRERMQCGNAPLGARAAAHLRLVGALDTAIPAVKRIVQIDHIRIHAPHEIASHVLVFGLTVYVVELVGIAL